MEFENSETVYTGGRLNYEENKMRALLFTIILLFQTSVAQAEGGADFSTVPEGEFVLVALRAASDVEYAPLDRSIDRLIGKSVSFDESVIWFDDAIIDDYFSVRPFVAVINALDPNLSDVMIRPPEVKGAEDCRVMNSMALESDGKTIDIIMMIDRRVLVVPVHNDSLYAIFEKPLEAEEVERLQAFLIEQGQYSDKITGEMDEGTIIAAGFYADIRGADYRFARTVITENLLSGLGIFNSEIK